MVLMAVFLSSTFCVQPLSVRCSATTTELPKSLQTLVQAFQAVPDPMAVSWAERCGRHCRRRLS